MATPKITLIVSARIFFILTIVLAGCTSSRIVLPDGSGEPFLNYKEVFDVAVNACSRVRTVELMMTVKGQTRDSTLRGQTRVALMQPGFLRLEALAPFGPPGFVLIAEDDNAVLLLPRENRVVTDASSSELLKLLAGVSLTPSDFRALLTGCLVPEPRPLVAWTYGKNWIGIELVGDATLYLRRFEGIPRIVAGIRRGLMVEYLDYMREFPRRIHIQTIGPRSVETDLTATLSQMSINIEIDRRAFVPNVPGNFIPMSLEEFRGITGQPEGAQPFSAVP